MTAYVAITLECKVEQNASSSYTIQGVGPDAESAYAETLASAVKEFPAWLDDMHRLGDSRRQVRAVIPTSERGRNNLLSLLSVGGLHAAVALGEAAKARLEGK